MIVLLVAICAFTAAPSGAEAQIVMNPIPNNVFSIGGTVLCRVNETFPGGLASPFPRASVELRCLNLSVARTTTDESGQFNITLGPFDGLSQLAIQDLFETAVCQVIVTTLLVQCNANLPAAGNLVASLLASALSTANGLNVFKIAAGTFRLVSGLGI